MDPETVFYALLGGLVAVLVLLLTFWSGSDGL
jgi:hypothetical protein